MAALVPAAGAKGPHELTKVLTSQSSTAASVVGSKRSRRVRYAKDTFASKQLEPETSDKTIALEPLDHSRCAVHSFFHVHVDSPSRVSLIRNLYFQLAHQLIVRMAAKLGTLLGALHLSLLVT